MKHIAPLRIVEVCKVLRETSLHTTISFKDNTPARPGQFLMVWLPGVDEVPMGYSRLGETKEFTVHNVGSATQALCNLSEGESIGVRGPLGNSFNIQGERLLVVGGGCGTSPLVPLAEEAAGQGKEVISIIGANTKEMVLNLRRFSKCGEVHISTDDGSSGFHGTASQLAKDFLHDVDSVYACGPEKMTASIVQECLMLDIPCQASLERYMKCGIGICDSCAISGKRVCSDGPVFNGSDLKEMPEFGRWRRGPHGGREML